MKQAVLFSILLFTGYCGLNAQTTTGFEDIPLPVGSFLNGSDGSGGFRSGNLFLPNNYNAAFMAWEDWAISSVTNNQTPGFGNQYSAITGSGHNASANYAVGYSFNGSVLRLEGPAAGQPVEDIYVTNSTYAYLSMRDGDAFSKKFGGETGNDPDFFLLTIKKYLNGQLGADSVNFYLADFRFANNAQDYIVNDWTRVNLLPLGSADSLLFLLQSSDVGVFGINTPTYFCIDDVRTSDGATNSQEPRDIRHSIRVFPNPAADFIQIENMDNIAIAAEIFRTDGQCAQRFSLNSIHTTLDIRHLPAGIYLLRAGTQSIRFIKQ